MSTRARSERPDTELGVDLAGYDVYRNGFPHELFRVLRDQRPVWRHPTVPTRRCPDGVSFWAVLGHPEVQAVSRDWRTYTALEGFSLRRADPEHQGHTLLTTDPPAHTRLRRLVSAGFTPRMIARLDELVVYRANQVLDAAADKRSVNFVRDVAYALPMHMISDIVGIPEADRPEVFAWTDTMMRAADPGQNISVEEEADAQRSLFTYGARLGEQKRRQPTDDVWSILCTASFEDEHGQRSSLSPGELDWFFLILTIAGSETTRNAISTGLVALTQHREQMDALRRDDTLLGPATEEILRWASPVTCHTRTATREHELGGQQIERGDRLAMFFPSANRDGRVFHDADRFDIRRDPNPHVTFGGGGPHFCLGAHLARREIAVLFRRLLARFPDLEITGPARYVVTAAEPTVAVSLDDLPVRFGEPKA